MLREQRQREIVRRVEQEGSVTASRIAHDLGVDVSTIRRDLERLDRSGLVERARGGAIRSSVERIVDVPYDLKRSVELEAKVAIARAASLRIDHGQTILLDSGSTTFQLVPWLRHHRGITVVTNDLHIAHTLANRPGIRLVLAGGLLLESVYTLVGPQTIAALAELHVDHAFLGADAIDDHAGITNVNLVEVAVKRAMMAAAERTTVLADSTKFGKRALAHVAALEEIDEVITDDRVPAEVRERYAGLPMTYVPIGRSVANGTAPA